MEKNCRVLVADCSDNFGKPCARALRGAKLDADCVEKDGRILLDYILKSKPDVVIMDMFMPNLDAIGVMKGVRKQMSGALPKFIVVLSFDNPMIESEVMAAGADYFFLRPIEHEEIAARVASLYGGENTAVHSSEESIEVKVTQTLHQIGVPAHIKGYQYLREAILMTIAEPDSINAVTKLLYPGVAKRFSTTSSRVERAIRHAIEVAWDRGDVEVLNSYFGYTIQSTRGKPTNSEFIAMIADKFRLTLKAC